MFVRTKNVSKDANAVRTEEILETNRPAQAYRSPELFVVGTAAELVQGGYGIHWDFHDYTSES